MTNRQNRTKKKKSNKSNKSKKVKRFKRFKRIKRINIIKDGGAIEIVKSLKEYIKKKRILTPKTASEIRMRTEKIKNFENKDPARGEWYQPFRTKRALGNVANKLRKSGLSLYKMYYGKAANAVIRNKIEQINDARIMAKM